MDRIQVASSALAGIPLRSLLDVGCRGGVLRRYLPPEIDYFGCDLEPGEHVRYVGDVQSVKFDRTFDCVVALDVLEHVDQLHTLFDKLSALATKLLVVSLPNCYDLKSRVRFGIRGRLGGKYDFGPQCSVDRHRWVMGYSEIRRFYLAKAHEQGLKLTCIDCRYGDAGSLTFTGAVGIALRAVGPALTAETVIGVFRRPDVSVSSHAG